MHWKVQSKQNTHGYIWHRHRGRRTREGQLDHVIQQKWNFYTRSHRSFSDAWQGRESKRESGNERARERGYGSTRSLHRSPKKGILDPADAQFAPPEKRHGAYSLCGYTINQIQKIVKCSLNKHQENNDTSFFFFPFYCYGGLSWEEGLEGRTTMFRQKANQGLDVPLWQKDTAILSAGLLVKCGFWLRVHDKHSWSNNQHRCYH